MNTSSVSVFPSTFSTSDYAIRICIFVIASLKRMPHTDFRLQMFVIGCGIMMHLSSISPGYHNTVSLDYLPTWSLMLFPWTTVVIKQLSH